MKNFLFSMKTNHLLILVMLCTLPVAGFAQAKKDSAALQKHMDEVVITGQYAPNDPSRAVQKIKVIGRQKIEMMNAQNLKDVLSNELNIRISNDNILGSSVSIGGVSGRNVKILIDGVPVVGRQDGNIDLSQINLNNIERIEIVEGPMSVNYGTDALGGAINLITKKELKKEFEGNVSLYHETIGTYNLQGRLGYSKKKNTITLNAGRNFFDGWVPGEKLGYDYSSKIADSTRYMPSKPCEQYFSTLQYIYKVDENTTLNYKGDYFQEKITNRDYPDQTNDAMDDIYRTSRIDNAVFINSKIRKGTINALISYNDYKRTKNTYLNHLESLESALSIDSSLQDTSNFNQFNTRGTYSNEVKALLFNYEVGYDLNVQNATGRRIKTGKQFMGDYAGYASLEFKPWNRLTIRPGLRYAYNTSYDAPLIPSVNVAYKTTDHLTLRASYSKGFRAPDLKELYFYFNDINHDIKGNKDLKAEYSDNYNASFVYTNMTGKLLYKVDVSGFYNDILDMISLAFSGGASGREYTYINVGRFKSKGLQANADFTINNLKLSIGGSYIGRYNEYSEVDASLDEFTYASEIRGSVTYTMPKQGISIAAFYKFTGRLPGYGVNDSLNIVPTYINQYQIADVNVSKKFFEGKLQAGIGCKNLFNISSVRSFMVSDGAHSSPSAAILGNGRLYFIKLDYNF
jgi:outer membrane receptor for ferrienterochelin and colicins